MANNLRRYIYFDLSRFVAITGVIAAHVGGISQNFFFLNRSITGLGRFGVQLFFVVSGATIYMTYIKALNDSDRVILKFYIKRFFRIIPLFIFMAFIYSILDGVSFFKSLIPWSGLDPTNYNNIEGGWSIWNEMYFYLVFPAYYVIRKRRFNIVILSILLSVISLIINDRVFFRNIENDILLDYDYLNFATQFIAFVIGVEFFGGRKSNGYIFLATYFIIGIVYKIMFYEQFLLVSDYGALYWTAAISMASALILILLRKLVEILKNLDKSYWLRPLARIGQITYTSYMVHFLVLRVFESVILDWYAEVAILFVAGMTFLIAWVLRPITETIWSDIAKIINSKL